ncbi:MAG: hypothetical protein AAFO75_02350 [Pseudomonadota bacterium]
MKSETMSRVRHLTTVTLGLAVAAVFVTVSLAPQPAVAKKRMTCSFIAKQCKVECTKEVNEGFCSAYCADKRAECLSTGQWIGISRKFTKVIRR